PLYRVKKGKKELYLKNEGALEDYLLESAAENLKLRSASAKNGSDGIAGEERRRYARTAAKYKRLLQVMDRKVDARIIDGIVKSVRLTKEDLKDQMRVARAPVSLQKYFDRFAPELSETTFTELNEDEHRGQHEVDPV